MMGGTGARSDYTFDWLMLSSDLLSSLISSRGNSFNLETIILCRFLVACSMKSSFLISGLVFAVFYTS